jgi:hypothetical protein
VTLILTRIQNGWTVAATGVDNPECAQPMWFKGVDEALEYIKKLCNGRYEA